MSCETRTVINGGERLLTHPPEASALEILRRDVGLTGPKPVCGAGVCGACTVLVDGVPTVSCLAPAGSLAGRRVETIESFDAGGLHPVQKAFLAHDALQCGFCTPGFVTEAIAFYRSWRAEHDSGAAPTREAIAKAMSGHLCRCGAYAGIYAAVRAACAGEFDDVDEFACPRHDGPEKVTGRARYTVDVRYDDMLAGRIVGSPHAHARVVALDLDAARAVPGVRAVCDVLTDPHRTVRYVGHPVAAIAAVDEAAARAAGDAMAIEYDVRPFTVDPEAARSADAPVVYPERRKRTPNASEGPIPPGRWDGNVRTPFANLVLSRRRFSARRALRRAGGGARGTQVIEMTFDAPAQTHTALEPHACVAKWDGDRLTVHASTQSVHLLGKEIAKRFDLPAGNVAVHAEHVGGAFGSKQGLTLEIETAIRLSREAGAPVRLVHDRIEELVRGGCRPSTRLEMALAVGEEGEQRGISVRAYGNCGVAVQSQAAPWIRFTYRGPKDCKDFDVTTNSGPAKPMRAPCGPPAFWALESCVDEAAHRLGIDPVALRRSWETSDVRDGLYDWVETLPAWRDRGAVAGGGGRFRSGIGLAIGNWFNAFDNSARVELEASGGGVVVRCAAQDMGQGVRSVLARPVAEELGLSFDEIEVDIGLSTHPKGPASSGSRSTATLYPIALEAARKLAAELVSRATTELGLDEAEWVPGGIRHARGEIELGALVDELGTVSVTSQKRGGNGPFDLLGRLPTGDLGLSLLFEMTGSVCVMAVEVDTRLGLVRPTKAWMGVSAGKIVNPELATSQVQGAVVQGIGFALTEERLHDPLTGTLLSSNLEDYRIPGIGETPEIEVHFDASRFEKMRGGACGMSELVTLPVPGALANAVFHATGRRPRTLPLRPRRVRELLETDGG